MNNSSIQSLLDIMTKLRNPDGGCPWDLQQDFRSIVPHTLEEAYEVADAIERDDMESLKDELGDLLFQVVFYAQLGAEQSLFNFDDIVTNLEQKLVRRHPHVFGDETAKTEAQVKEAWERIKAQERAAKHDEDTGPARILDDVPVGMPSLTRAQKLQQKASRAGFDWPNIDGALAKLDEEVEELREAVASTDADRDDQIEHELGDVVFTAINVARFAKVDTESATRYASERFTQRFGWIEDRLHERGESFESCDSQTLGDLWDQAKIALAQPPGVNP